MARLKSITKDVQGIPGPEIDVRAIERELASLWAIPQAVEDGGIETLPTRTSVLNLVIYAPNSELADRASRLIESLATYHPSRVIIFSVIDDPRLLGTNVDARVSSYCRVDSPGEVAACVEQVMIAVPPDALQLLPSIIAPLTLPDLPTFLWWMGQPPLNDARLCRLSLATDRLILDSSEFTRPPACLIREAEFCRQQATECMISDLNWARVTGWRETISQFFDIPDCRWALEYVTRLSIRYGHADGRPDNPTQALLLIGWMSDRLGWHVESAERRSESIWTFSVSDPGGRPILVELISRIAPPAFDGQILAVNLSAGDGLQSAYLDAARVGDLSVISTMARTDGQLQVERAIHCPPPDLHGLLMNELKLVSRDRIFERALQET
ncbi:MAG TPA: glucose-6-phosphate dehydrogenase assembly protein OpcA, partial [Nitrolancea sp.]|nr:glucose-6-phosphate dehydrogenase assembly protein OpcA [Nitrolancea sp.]